MERWQLSAKELARYSVIENTLEGYLNIGEAREELYLSRRQVFRLKRKLKEEGVEGLIHGNRGRAPRENLGPSDLPPSMVPLVKLESTE